MIRADFIVRAVLILLFTYLLALGATFNGVLTPDFKQLTLLVMALSLGVWQFVRWRRGWMWHRTPLDGAFGVWAVAFVIALVFNLETARRSLIGLWYVGIYIVVWYVLCDLLANRALRRDTLVGAFLVSGIIILLFGYLQVQGWLVNRLPLMTAGVIPFDLPRPVSLIGNTNGLACFLLVLIPLVGAVFSGLRRRFERWVMGVYGAAALLMLFLTYSRGAWLGFAVGAGVGLALTLASHNLLSVARLREVWGSLGRRGRWTVIISSVSVFLCGLLAAFLLVRSLSQPGRDVSRRTVLFEPAVQLIAEKPITGHGLFTFGRGYTRLESMPPAHPHSHAHNIVLLVAAELGLTGSAALLFTAALIFFAGRDHWRALAERKREQFLLNGAAGAVGGFGAHHLLDTPAMMPAVALTGLLALVLWLAPPAPAVLRAKGWRLAHPAGILSAVLLLTGFWSSGQYTRYLEMMRQGVTTGEYRAAAEQLQSVIDADPALALYHQQQAFLYGLAAYQGDNSAAQAGIAAFERFLAYEPQSASAWANKAALHWQLSEYEQATTAMAYAAARAPDSWQFRVNLGMYYEALGQENEARLSFRAGATVCTVGYAIWQETVLRRAIAAEFTEPCPRDTRTDNTRAFVLRALDALENGSLPITLDALARARAVSTGTPDDMGWLYLGSAYVARAQGDAAAKVHLEAGRALFGAGVSVIDYESGVNIALFQFMRQAISRQFLPQLYYPTADPLLLRLLAEGI